MSKKPILVEPILMGPTPSFIRVASCWRKDLTDAKDERIAELEAKLAEYQNEKAGTVVIDSSDGKVVLISIQW